MIDIGLFECRARRHIRRTPRRHDLDAIRPQGLYVVELAELVTASHPTASPEAAERAETSSGSTPSSRALEGYVLHKEGHHTRRSREPFDNFDGHADRSFSIRRRGMKRGRPCAGAGDSGRSSARASHLGVDEMGCTSMPPWSEGVLGYRPEEPVGDAYIVCSVP